MIVQKRRVAAALTLVTALFLTGCAQDNKESQTDSPTATNSEAPQTNPSAGGDPVAGGSDSPSSGTSGASETPSEDPAVSQARLPVVSEKFGESPTFAWTGESAPAGLVVKVVESTQPDGAQVGENDFVVVNYAGRTWDSEAEFDSSFSRGSVALFSLNGVVSGWKLGLAGTHVGDRVILSIPPEHGYGAQGNPNAGIGGTDTIVFVVDLVDAFAPDVTIQEEAVDTGKAAELPVDVNVDVTQPAKIGLRDNAPAPTEPQSVLIARGSGPTVTAQASSVLVQYAAANWDGSESYSTWEGNGPEPGQIGAGTVLDQLIGVPVGSRVVILVPANEATGSKAAVLAIDVLAVY